MVYGALNAFKISAKISKWVIPDKYYVSFPYGLCNPKEVMNARKWYRTEKNFYMVKDNKTVQDNIYTSFTFGKDEFINTEEMFAKEQVDTKELWKYGRHFQLKKALVC